MEATCRRYYRRFGGAVVSTAIDKFVYINVNKRFDNSIRVSYSRTEEVDSVDRVEHPIVRAALNKLNIDGGLEITSIADIPSRGTGLGSSSSFTAGLLLGLHAYQSTYVSPGDLAEESCHVEIDLCGEPIGKQDQYAAAFGGLNYIRFEPDDTVIVEPILLAHDGLCALENSPDHLLYGSDSPSFFHPERAEQAVGIRYGYAEFVRAHDGTCPDAS